MEYWLIVPLKTGCFCLVLNVLEVLYLEIENYCSHSEVKLVAKIKSIAASELKGGKAEWAVILVSEREVHGSNPGVVNYFFTHNEKFI